MDEQALIERMAKAMRQNATGSEAGWAEEEGNAFASLSVVKQELADVRSALEISKRCCLRADEVEAENQRLHGDNAKLIDQINLLRAALANSKDPCVYCQLPAEKMAECRAGFPGCSRMDDITGCPEFGAMMNEYQMRELFSRYMQRVFDCEGSDFIPDSATDRTNGGAPTAYLSDDDITILKGVRQSMAAITEDGDATLARFEDEHPLISKIGQAYQVVGVLTHENGSAVPLEEIERALDYFADEARYDPDFLPWPRGNHDGADEPGSL